MLLQPTTNEAPGGRVSAVARPVEFEGPILFLVALITAFSCSRYFGLDKIPGMPQVTFERGLTLVLCALTIPQIVVHRMCAWNLRLTEVGLLSVGLFAGISGIVFGGLLTGYAGGNPDILGKLWFIPALLFFVVLRSKLSDRQLAAFVVILVSFGVYLGGTAIAERFGSAWMMIPPEIGDPLIDHHWGRARGPFLQAEFNGTVMAMLLPMAVLLTSWKEGALRVLGWAAIVLLCAGCYLTQTRAALLSIVVLVAVGCAVGSRVRNSYRVLALLVATAAGCAWLAGAAVIPRLGETEPIYDRVRLLSVTAQMVEANPVTGIGFANFDHQQAQYYDPDAAGEYGSAELWEGGTHNTFLTPTAELGVFVGGLYVLLVARVFFLTFRLLRSMSPDNEYRAIVLSCMLIGAVFVTNGLLVELRYTLTPNALFWVGAALIERLDRRAPAMATMPSPIHQPWARVQASG